MSKFRRNLRGVVLNWDAQYVVNMQRGLLTRLAIAWAILQYHLLRFRVQVNDPHIIRDFYSARPCGWQFPRITELSGAIEMWLQEWKRLCRKMQMHLKPKCCLQHCAIALPGCVLSTLTARFGSVVLSVIVDYIIALPGCATENEQRNVGCRI